MDGPGSAAPRKHRVAPWLICYAYLQRFSIEEIGEMVGYGKSQVDKILREEGCLRRPRGIGLAGRKPSIPRREKLWTIGEHRKGRTLKEIGEVLGVSKQAVRQRLLRWGIIAPGGKPGRRVA